MPKSKKKIGGHIRKMQTQAKNWNSQQKESFNHRNNEQTNQRKPPEEISRFNKTFAAKYERVT